MQMTPSINIDLHKKTKGDEVEWSVKPFKLVEEGYEYDTEEFCVSAIIERDGNYGADSDGNRGEVAYEATDLYFEDMEPMGVDDKESLLDEIWYYYGNSLIDKGLQETEYSGWED